MTKFVTTRGELQELRYVEANLIATSQHLYDKPDLTADDLEILRSVNKARSAVRKMYADEIDTDYHCIDKHLLVASLQMKEYLESKLREGKKVDFEALDEIEFASNTALANLLKIPTEKLEQKGCFRCIDDYLYNKK